jgi:pyruvate-formate lyase-activating enzyme
MCRSGMCDCFCIGKEMLKKLKEDIVEEIRTVVIPDVIHRLNETYDLLHELENNIVHNTIEVNGQPYTPPAFITIDT